MVVPMHERTDPLAGREQGFCRNSGVWSKRVVSLSLRSNSEVVELLRCGHGLNSGAVHLPLADHVHGLDAGNDNAGTPK